MRKAKNLYEQGKGRESLQKSWKDKKKEKFDKRKKGFKLPSTETTQIKISKNSMLRMNIRDKSPLEKWEDHQSNVGDAKKITCTKNSHI